jgi:uncharacterized protein YqeY
MSLKQELRAKLTEARKTGATEIKNVLGVILGDVDTVEARTKKDMPDAEVEKLLRKLVESNMETLTQLKAHQRADDPRAAVLEREMAYLKSLLPQTLDTKAIADALEAVRADIVNAKSDGQATGVAMKHLKSLSLNAQGQDVSAVVKQFRTAT